MTENQGGNWVYDLAADETSGVRINPWLQAVGKHPQAAAAARPTTQALEERLALASAQVLSRFEGFTGEDRDRALDAALERLSSLEGGAAEAEARMAHAVLCAAAQREMRRWVSLVTTGAAPPSPRSGLLTGSSRPQGDTHPKPSQRAGLPKASPAEVARELARAGERAAALTGRERSVFFAVCALDDVAFGVEVRRVVLCGAVAYQMRWNTAHQHLSRAWRKICEGGPLADWCKDWRAGHRFVCGPPSFELWQAGRAYMDACSGRDGRGGEAFEAWAEAHDTHQDWFNEHKRQSTHATRRWREVVEALDASGARPADVQALLVQRCVALDIDRWVVPAKLCQQSWHDLLGAAQRPSPQARAAWRSFVGEHRFGRAVDAAFRAFEQGADLVEVANAKLEQAHRHLLAAADAQPSETLLARDAFRSLVDEVTVSGGASFGRDAPRASSALSSSGGEPWWRIPLAANEAQSRPSRVAPGV